MPAEKFIIGLTGNIATGKSVVRKMLEHLGAYGIDADALTHRVLAKDAPGYQPTVDQFGKYIVGADGEIDREKLGALVFSDPDALKNLEAIVHPYVRKAIDHLISKSPHNVIVIEAIKLLESPIRDKVNAIWVTTADQSVQLERLQSKRGMDAEKAQERMANQSSQAIKVAEADTVINNNGSFEDTWKQVQQNWHRLFPKGGSGETIIIPADSRPVAPDINLEGISLEATRARPRQAEDIGIFINRVSGGSTKLTRMDIMAAFGEKAYILLVGEKQILGVVGFQVENLVARVDELWLVEGLDHGEAILTIMKSVEKASRELQAEASLVFIKRELASQKGVWIQLGYEHRSIDSLSVTAWREAAINSQPEGTDMLFKQLRVDRVLRPI